MLTLGFVPDLAGVGRRIGPTAQAAWTRKRTLRRAGGCFSGRWAVQVHPN
jgi:hypothetical protein